MAQDASQGGQPPLTPRRGKVTVVGAGFYGSTTAQRLAEYDIFDEVVLTDIVDGKPEGLALDMNQSRPVEGFETTMSTASGACFTTFSTTPRTILALTSIRSIRLMPGLRGSPALTMTIPDPPIAS